MPRIALTDLSIRSLSSDTRQDFWDTKLPSFGVRVGPRSKTFIVKVGNGRRSVGTYPETSLADARKRAMGLKAEKPKPGNPITFREAYEDFKKFHVARKKKNTQDSYTRMIEGYYLPSLCTRVLESITYRQISAITDELNDRRGEQWHCIAVGRTFFKFCVRRHYISASPMEGVQIVKDKPRDRVLTDDEVKTIWNVTGDGSIFSSIVRLLILTGQRCGEIAALQTSWINGDEITFPSEITKNGRESRVPVSPLCLSVLNNIFECGNDCQLYFPARGSGKSQTTFKGWSKSKHSLDKKLGDAVAPWTLHDLRRTFASTMQRLGVRLEVTERLLNHVSGTQSGIVGIYQRYDFRTEMREAVEKYEQHLLTLLSSS